MNGVSFYYASLIWLITLFLHCCLTAHPNILFILADDLGWGQVGFHQENGEINTPNMDDLVKNGVELTRHYVHYVCSPTRSSFQSGRLPVHVTIDNNSSVTYPYQGVTINMTCIATKMKQANYSTHLIGKWDAGMATFTQIPIGRGYDTSFGYLGHANNYFTQRSAYGCSHDFADLWDTDKPAYGINGSDYEDFLFANRIYKLLDDDMHNNINPFFLVYTPHIAHNPLMIPKEYYTKWDNDENNCSGGDPYIYPGMNTSDLSQWHCRSIVQSMVNLLDIIIGNITDILKRNNLWNNTLIVFASDNGAPSGLKSTAGNNYPLRGTKFSPWEGGIRSASFVSGGYIPESRRGHVVNGMISIADWYTTFCEMVGVDPTDHKAAENGLPPVDGLNIWPLIIGENNTSPRTEIAINEYVLIQDSYKLITHSEQHASWSGPIFPNSSSPQHPFPKMNCAKTESGVCLFDVVNDMTEHNEISSQNPHIVQKMVSRLNELKQGFFYNNVSGVNSCPSNINISCGCWIAYNYWNDYCGPYQDLTNISLATFV